MSTPEISFFVHGEPKPAGSKRAFPIRRGGVFVRNVVVDTSGAAGKSWRALVQDRAIAAMDGRDVLEGPLRLTCEFWLVRPKGHHGKRGLLPSAPAYPAKKPDATKLVRAVEDALTGIVWRDDAQVVTQHVYKRFSESSGVMVNVSEEVAL